MGQPPTATGRQIRRRFAVDGRVRTGCSTCKARKKKCDGQASSSDGRCGSCVRLGLVCERAPLRTVAPRMPRRRTQRDDSESASPRPLVRDTEIAGGGSSSSSSGGSSPAEEETTTHDEFSDLAPGAVAIRPSRSPPPTVAIPGTLDDVQRILLRYFLDRVAPLCSILQQDGPSFCSVLLPMAIVDPSLLQALFTYASAHLEATTPGKLVTSDDRLRFESQMARGVAEAITRDAVTESTVACALLTSTAEVIRGDTSRWLLHLEGAGHLVNHLGASSLLRSADGTFLLRYFAYHDIMASLSTGRRTLGSGVYWVRDAEATVRSADSFMGLAHHVFRYLVEICALVAETSEFDAWADPDRRARCILRAEDLAQALRLQDLHLAVDANDGHIEALIHHAEAFRHAGMLYVYRQLLRFHEAGAAVYRLRIDDCVRQILRHVSDVPANMFCEIGLLFPLFMAGIGSGGDGTKRHYIRDRLGCIETWTKFRHVGRARELLELLWERGRTDWEVMLRELDWNLSLA